MERRRETRTPPQRDCSLSPCHLPPTLGLCTRPRQCLRQNKGHSSSYLPRTARSFEDCWETSGWACVLPWYRNAEDANDDQGSSAAADVQRCPRLHLPGRPRGRNQSKLWRHEGQTSIDGISGRGAVDGSDRAGRVPGETIWWPRPPSPTLNSDVSLSYEVTCWENGLLLYPVPGSEFTNLIQKCFFLETN